MIKKFKLIFTVLLLALVLSCKTDPALLDSFLMFNGDIFNAESDTLDFGKVMTGSTDSEVSGIIQNTGDNSITVTSILINDTENYALTPFTLPYELDVGSEATFALTFKPVSSGIKPATLTIGYDFGEEAVLSVEITGTGNDAPEAVFGITVSGAVQYPDVNGFYLRNGLHNSAPMYTKSGTTAYHIYYFIPDGSFWGINDDTSNITFPSYSGVPNGPVCFIGAINDTQESTYYPPEVVLNEELAWKENFTSYPEFTVKTGLTRNGEILSSNHVYSDNENDAETGTIYQWYRSTTVDGSYSLITGATTSAVSVADEVANYIRLSVTPVDSNGFTGKTVTSDPYYVEALPLPIS